MSTTDKQDAELRRKLNLETARLAWSELERHFASGAMIYVSDELDLIDVAVRIAQDDKEMVAQWLEDKRIAKVSDKQAKMWHDLDASLWAVVVRPWILVQLRLS
jgi:hypothetical protein